MIFNPADPPRWFTHPVGSAQFKALPSDFVVEELLGFEPSGIGEHCFVWIEKVDRNSNEIAAELAVKLGIRSRLVSHSGLKDRFAITRQWFSLHMPGKESPTAQQLEVPGVSVLRVTRHLRKLRRGSHRGNRFTIRLRNCDFSAEQAAQRWQEISTDGVPNYFGPQRFGSGANNVEMARQWLSGSIDIRDRALRGILLSAARSTIFNRCLANRVVAKNWNVALDGEVYGFEDNHSLVLPFNLRGDEAARVGQGTLELTGPLWGDGQPPSIGEVQALEVAAAQQEADIQNGLSKFNLKQERRVLRVRPKNLQIHWENTETMVLQFDLPTGTYATALLREFIRFPV